MRIIYTLLLLCGFTLSSAFSQVVNSNTHFISESEVPKPVIQIQKELFPTNFVSEWNVQKFDKMQDASNIRYIANFKEDGRSGFSASYLPEGLLLFKTEFIPNEILSEEIKVELQKEYKGFTVESANFITLYNPKREVYMIRLLHNAEMQYAFYDTEGNSIQRDNLPPEMLLLLR